MQLTATKLVGLRSRLGVISSLQATVADAQTEIKMAPDPRPWEQYLPLLESCLYTTSCNDSCWYFTLEQGISLKIPPHKR